MTSLPAFPAASRATTTIALSPATSAIDPMLQLVVPEAVPFAPIARFVQTTLVTARLSDAVPPMERGEENVVYVGDDVGVEIAHTGAVTSGGV
jgi:hypothetical protein